MVGLFEIDRLYLKVSLNFREYQDLLSSLTDIYPLTIDFGRTINPSLKSKIAEQEINKRRDRDRW